MIAEASIPVDLLNPGQVFGCLGFLEAAEVLCGEADGRFDWTSSAKCVFRLRANGAESPIIRVLRFIMDAKSISISPSKLVCERDGGETQIRSGIHPRRLGNVECSKDIRGDALLPIELTSGTDTLRFDYWADLNSRRPQLRLWTATNGNSAAARFVKLHKAFRTAVVGFDEQSPDPFSMAAPVAANFRLELRRNWTSLGAGFSPDKHTDKKTKGLTIEVATYPAVEILAALGLGNARPRRHSSSLLIHHYSAWADWLPPELARAAIPGALPSFNARSFLMHLEKPNDGGDHSIAFATEETRR